MHSNFEEQVLSLKALLVRLPLNEMISLKKTNTTFNQQISACFSDPSFLFQMLDGLKQAEILPFIRHFCHPDTDCYKAIERLARVDDQSSPVYTYAYICFALITCDVSDLKLNRLRVSHEFIKEHYPSSALLQSIFCIWDINIQLKNTKSKSPFKNVQTSNAPCYVNYSGIDFSKRYSERVIEKIDFSHGNCRGIKFTDCYLMNCNFSNAHISFTEFFIKGGMSCNFENASFNEVAFIDATSCAHLNALKNRLDALQEFLSKSLKVDTLKSAIRVSITSEINKIADKDFREQAYHLLAQHPFTAVHRNTGAWVVNGVLSIFSKSNVIKTQGEKELERLKNRKTESKSISISQNQFVKINELINKYILDETMPDNIKLVAQLLVYKDLLSFMLTCKGFAENSDLKKMLQDKNTFSIFVGLQVCFYLTRAGKLFGVGNNAYCQLGFANNPYIHPAREVSLNLHKNERVKHIALSETHSILITSFNRVIFSGFIEMLKPNNRALTFTEIDGYKFQDGENIEGFVTGAYATYLFTDKNRILGLPGKSEYQLQLPPDEKIKQIAVDRNYHILINTTKGRLLQVSNKNEQNYLCLQEREDTFFKEHEQIVLLEGRMDSNQLVIMLTSLNRLIAVKGKQYIECAYPILNENEYINQISIGITETTICTNIGRLFLCEHEFTHDTSSFKEYTILGLRDGECVRTLKAGYKCLYLVTNMGRVLYNGSNGLNEKESTATFIEHHKNEEEIIFCEEKMLFEKANESKDSQRFGL